MKKDKLREKIEKVIEEAQRVAFESGLAQGQGTVTIPYFYGEFVDRLEDLFTQLLANQQEEFIKKIDGAFNTQNSYLDIMEWRDIKKSLKTQEEE